MVQLKIKLSPDVTEADEKRQPQKKVDKKDTGKGKEKEKVPLAAQVLDIPDDNEYGGELAGRLVWESYEQNLKVWEKETPPTERDKERERIDKEQAPAPQRTQDNPENRSNYY